MEDKLKEETFDEKLLGILVENCQFVDECKRHCNREDRVCCYGISAKAISESFPKLAREKGWFQEEADWCGKLIDAGWIPPEEVTMGKWVKLADNQDLPLPK